MYIFSEYAPMPFICLILTPSLCMPKGVDVRLKRATLLGNQFLPMNPSYLG